MSVMASNYIYFTKSNYNSEEELKSDITNTIFTLLKNGYDIVIKDEGIGFPLYFVDTDENISGERIEIIDTETQFIQTYSDLEKEDESVISEFA